MTAAVATTAARVDARELRRLDQPGAPAPSIPLVAGAVAVAVVFAAPLGYLLVRVIGLDVAGVLDAGGILAPLGRSLLLGTTVGAASAVIGVGLAWLTMRTDLPGRRLWTVLAPLPLVFPSFIGAAALLAAVAPGGLVDTVWPGLGVDRLPEVDGFGGAFVVLTLFTYPYVYLPVAARLRSLPVSFEESARLLGRTPGQVFRSVVMPQIAGAAWAGSLLVFLYVLSDFGAVAQLQYRTLTVDIYENRLFNQERSLVLGLLLGVAAIVVVSAERGMGRRRARVESSRRGSAFGGRTMQVPLGRWRWPAAALVAFLAANALLGPLSVLGFWSIRGGIAGLGDLGEPAVSTALLSLGAALVAVVVVLPAAYLTARHRSPLGAVVNGAVVAGFALPGLLIALAVVFWSLSGPRWLASLYQTVPLLLGAYVVHFGAQAMRAGQVAVAAVPPRLDDAARMLGASRWRRLRSIDLPIMLPGLVAGGGLVLLSTMKELPATLLLRPTAVETLAVHVWRARERAAFAETGTSALVLVGLCGLLTWLLVLRRSDALA